MPGLDITVSNDDSPTMLQSSGPEFAHLRYGFENDMGKQVGGTSFAQLPVRHEQESEFLYSKRTKTESYEAGDEPLRAESVISSQCTATYFERRTENRSQRRAHEQKLTDDHCNFATITELDELKGQLNALRDFEELEKERMKRQEMQIELCKIHTERLAERELWKSKIRKFREVEYQLKDELQTRETALQETKVHMKGLINQVQTLIAEKNEMRAKLDRVKDSLEDTSKPQQRWSFNLFTQMHSFRRKKKGYKGKKQLGRRFSESSSKAKKAKNLLDGRRKSSPPSVESNATPLESSVESNSTSLETKEKCGAGKEGGSHFRSQRRSSIVRNRVTSSASSNGSPAPPKGPRRFSSPPFVSNDGVEEKLRRGADRRRFSCSSKEGSVTQKPAFSPSA